jgi:hypothetical protein
MSIAIFVWALLSGWGLPGMPSVTPSRTPGLAPRLQLTPGRPTPGPGAGPQAGVIIRDCRGAVGSDGAGAKFPANPRTAAKFRDLQ